MAESLITQVQRPDDQASGAAAAGQPRPSRKPKLKLELDANGNPIQPAGEAASGTDEKADVDNRSTGMGKIFSRQFTPTVPKTDFFQDKDRVGAQSPRGVKGVQSPKSGLATHDENEEVQVDEDGNKVAGPPSPSTTTGDMSNLSAGQRRTLWQSIWSCFLSDNEPRASNMAPRSDIPASNDENAAASANASGPVVVPNVNSPKGQSKPQDFPAPVAATPAPVAAVEEVEEEFVRDPDALLPPNVSGKKMCLVLDLDETLVHSSFKPVPTCDFILSIEMDGITHKVYVLKRPGVDEFLQRMAKTYELVIFTASLDKYANPLLDLLDPTHLITGRLYREHCTRQGQTYVKDLSRLGRRLGHSLIIDNSPYSYAMHLNYAVPILSWFDDPHDTELLDMMPFLENLTKLNDVSQVLDANKPWRVTNKKLLKLLNEAEQE
jgi:carboxy-terminal domain RNA polymerase II polypeptide A small phosphatase